MINVTILGNSLQIPCEGEDCEQLQKSIALLENKLEHIPDNMRNESRLILLAINLCYDYLRLKNESLEFNQTMESNLLRLLENTPLSETDVKHLSL